MQANTCKQFSYILRASRGLAKTTFKHKDIADGYVYSTPTEPITATENTKFLAQPWKQAITLSGYKQADESQENVKDHFNVITWSGNEAENDIGVGFEPGLFWAKQLNDSGTPDMRDIVRGNTKSLSPNNTDDERTGGDSNNGYDGFQEFTSSGVKLNGIGDGGNVNSMDDTTPREYVGWSWKAGGAPTSTDSAVEGSEMVD